MTYCCFSIPCFKFSFVLQLFYHVLSLVCLSDWVEFIATSHVINDLSGVCNGGRFIRSYITNGMGINDVSISMIAKETVQCTVYFHVHETAYIILVVEFLDWIPGQLQCGNANNSIVAALSDDYAEDICSGMENKNIYRKLGKREMSLTFTSLNDLRTLKIIATSATPSRLGKCKEWQVSCGYDTILVCMTDAVKCDGHVNCGLRDKYDESGSLCKNVYLAKPDLVFFGITTLFVSVFLIVSILRGLLPTRQGTFISRCKGSL